LRTVEVLKEILKNFWYRLKWKGKFVIGGLMIIGWDLRGFFERRKRKGVKDENTI